MPSVRAATSPSPAPRRWDRTGTRWGTVTAAQARTCFEIIRAALQEVGADLTDVIRTRTILTRIEDYEKVMVVHGEFLRDIRPASTVMQISRFIDPDWLVEIEADAIVEE